MMAVTYSFLTLILCLLTGGGNDLLDYLPTEAYWAEKKVAVSIETMAAELAPRPVVDVAGIIPDLGSPDAAKRDAAAVKIREAGPSAMKALTEAAESPDAELRRRARTVLRQVGADEIEWDVRRLMAIRTLGELGKPEAVATLKPLIESKDFFTADYARTAIDLLEGRRSNTARPVAANVASDVWLLPKECHTVGQLVPRRGSPLGIAEFMAAIKADGAADEDAQKQEAASSVTRTILSLAEDIGNVRIDAATFGIVGSPMIPGAEGAPGYLAVIVRGRYHSEWARTLAKSAQMPVTQVDGVEMFQPDGESAWLMPSDELFVFLASPTTEGLPVKELVSAIKEGKGPLASDEKMHKLVESVDAKQVLWAASSVTESQKTLPVAGAFDTITLVGTRAGKSLSLKLTGRGRDAAEVQEAVNLVNKHAKESAEFLSGIQVASVIRMAIKLLNSVEATAEGTSAAVTASLETTPAAILSLPMLYDDLPGEPQEEEPQPRRRGLSD
jgi:hypothetical protein